VCASWKDPNADADLQQFVKDITIRIKNAGEENGIQIGSCYPNYAIFDTPLTEMYGTNIEKLKKIKGRVDPTNVMGLAGGFKF
jgi:FAD/FMN-containing dehydrogenase